QPTNVDPPVAVAASVPVSLLPRFDTVQVVVHVTLLLGAVVSLTATFPVPVPAKVIVRSFLAAATYVGVAAGVGAPGVAVGPGVAARPSAAATSMRPKG